MASRKAAVTVTVPQVAAPVVTMAAPQAMTDEQRFAMLSQKPFAALTRDDKAFLTDYDRKQSKALDGQRLHFGIAEDNDSVLQMDIQTIAIQPGVTKHTADGRPYLFSLDGFDFTYKGVQYTAGSFYATQSKAKAK